MNLPRYLEYRDSGLPWLGSVPEHWTFAPLWVLFNRTKRTGFEGEQLLSVYRDHGVVPKASRDDNNNKPSDDLSPYQLVCPGDLAINKMKAWQGSVAISEHRGIVSPAYFVYEAKHQESSRYLHYLMRSPQYVAGYLSMSKGIRINQWDLEPQYHSRLPVLIPPKEEQERIATFLDREIAKIDTLIAEQEKLLALLAEKRQATISHAVTRGLTNLPGADLNAAFGGGPKGEGKDSPSHPNAPMKDSGIPWLGEVPAHWDVVMLRRVVLGFEQGWSPECEARLAEGDEWGVLKAGCVNGGQFRPEEHKALPSALDPRPELEIRDGDVLMSRASGSPQLIGSVACVDSPPPRLMLSDKVFRLQLASDVRHKFFALAMRSVSLRAQIEQAIGGAEGLANNLPQARIKDFWIALPSLLEQSEIEGLVEQALSRFDALERQAKQSIDLLKERRSALISAAVTGKIDVRETA